MQKKRMVGIGLGPSNLALAIALEERCSEELEDWMFIEKNHSVQWHTGMLLEGSRLQISFLKDLVTMRNPTSYYTFINYLKCQDRLNQFINRGTFNVSRHEFTDYLNWIQRHLSADRIHMSRTVEQVVPVVDHSGDINELEIVYTDEQGRDYRTRANNVVVAVGGKPEVPKVMENIQHRDIFHSSQLLNRIKGYEDKSKKLRFGVIGSGQSAVEIIHYLSNHFSNSTIHSIFRKGTYKQTDSSPFVNEIFFPNKTDFMYNLADDSKRLEILREYWQTNYAAVELELLEGLYEKLYADRVAGKQHIHIHNYCEIKSVELMENGCKLSCKNVLNGAMEELELDVVILATGYNRTELPPFMDSIKPYMSQSEGRLSIARDYSLNMVPSFRPRIYLQGMSQITHGISDSLLSVIAIRSSEILESIVNREVEEVLQSEGVFS